jgi:hypothetical protein
MPVLVSCGAFLALHWIFDQAQERGIPVGAGPVIFIVLTILAVAIACFRFPNWRAEFAGSALTVGFAVLACVSATAGILMERRAAQRLSVPGVKVVNEPLYAVDALTNKVEVAQNTVFLPEEVLNYRSRDYPISLREHSLLPKDTVYGQRYYIAPDNFVIHNMVRLMGNDRTSIHQPTICLPAQGFRIVSTEEDVIRMTQPLSYDLPVVKLKLEGQLRDNAGEMHRVGGVYVYWFVSDKEVSARMGERLWQTSLNLVRTGVLTRWAYVICMAYCDPGKEEAAFERVKEFIQASVPEYQLTPVTPAAELTRAPDLTGKGLP